MELYIIAFRGISKNTSPFQEERDNLIYAGHCATYRRGERIIYGFHPTPEEVASFTDPDALFQFLWHTHSLHGSVQDDTNTFLRAHQLHLLGERSDVWKVPSTLREHDKQRIYDTLVGWYNRRRSDFLYQFPPIEHPDVNNCITFLERKAGLDIPYHAEHGSDRYGRIKVLIRVLREIGTPWNPEEDFYVD